MPSPSAPAAAPFDVLVLIAPAHRLEATSVVLAELPPALPVAVLIAPSGEGREAGSGLEDVRRLSPLPIREAAHGTALEAGCVYVAPPHVLLEVRPGLRCTLTPRDDLPSPRPLDQLLASLALSAGPRALVVVLGGEGQDGVDGARALRGVGGTVLVQRPEPATGSETGAERPRALTQAATLVLSPGTLGRVVADLLGESGAGRLHAEVGRRASEAQYRTLFDLMSAGFALCECVRAPADTDGAPGRVVDVRWLVLNAALTAQTGMTREVEGRTAVEVWGQVDDSWLRVCQEVVDTGTPARFEEEQRALGRWYDVSLFPQGGDRLACVYDDITARKQAEAALAASEARQAFLLGLSDALRPLTDPVAIQGEACRVTGEHLKADRTYYGQIDVARERFLVERDYVRGDAPSLAGEYSFAEFGLPLDILRAGAPVVVEDVATSPHIRDENRATFEAIALRSFLVVPLNKNGDLAVGLAATSTTPRSWSAEEASLLAAVAERTWDAVERAGAEAALRGSEERQAFLLKLSDALRPLTDSEAIQRVASRLVGEHFGVANANYARVEVEQGVTFYDVRGSYAAPGRHSVDGRHRRADFPGVTDGLHAGRAVVVSEVAADPTLSPEDKASYAAMDVATVALVPLVKEGRLTAILGAHDSQPRAWTANEVALLEEVAERTWAAVTSARAERALSASEERFRAVANLVPDLLWESRPDGFTTWYNGRWLDYTGQTFEQATGWGWTDAIHPEDREGSAQRYGQAVQAGQPLSQEHRIRRHDGEYRWFVVNTFPLRDERGEVVRVYGAATDIHHLRVRSALLEARVEERTRRLAELNTELASRTQALEAFADLTRSLAPHLDPSALIRRGQEIALSLLPEGYATYYEPEGPRWRLRAQVGDMRNPALQAAADAGLGLGQTPSLDQPWKNGSPFFQGHYAPDTDGLGALDHSTNAVATLPLTVGGRQVGVFAVALFGQRAWSGTDRAVLETVVHNLGLALERAEAVRALAEECDALSTFAHFAERASAIQDVPALARHATEVLQGVLSPSSAVYLEREGEVWRLRHASGHLDLELEAALRQGVPAELPGYKAPFERGEPVFFEHWDPGEHTPAPPVHLTAIAAYPLFPQDHPAGMLSMAVTDRPTWTEREKAVFRAVGDSFRLALERAAQLQQIERQRERLADLNAELGNLITRTAHNLEAPAQKLGHFLGPGPSDNPQALDGLSPYDPALLQDEITRLKGVAQDLRQLSQLETHPLTRELLPLGEVFAEVRGGVSLPPGRQAYWQVAPLPIVRGDRSLLRQALDVLMTFTLSATRGARYVTVGSHDVEGEVHVTVEDDGVSLSAEEAATLFDLAVRTDQGVPLLEGGGLIQVRRILARHGGWAWAEVGSGGRVVLAFPRDEAVNELEALFREDPPGR